MVFNDYDWENKTSVTALIKELKWDMLSTRRKIARVNIMHKAIGGHMALPCHDYFTPVRRHSRTYHANSFIPAQSSKDTFSHTPSSRKPSKIGTPYHKSSQKSLNRYPSKPPSLTITVTKTSTSKTKASIKKKASHNHLFGWFH